MNLLNKIWGDLKTDTIESAWDIALLETWDFEV